MVGATGDEGQSVPRHPGERLGGFSPAEADFSSSTAVLSEAPLTGAEFTAGPPEPGARNPP